MTQSEMEDSEIRNPSGPEAAIGKLLIVDKGTQIRVIMEVRGIETGDLKLDFDKDRVTVRSHKIGASLMEKLDLPYEVSPEGYDMYTQRDNKFSFLLTPEE